MSRQNVDSEDVRLTPLSPDLLNWVQRAYAVWNTDGPAAMVRKVWHPGIVWHDPPDSPDFSVLHGAQAVAKHLSDRLEAIGATVKVENAWSVHDGEVILVELSLHSGGQSSGVELDVPLFHLVRLSEGRVIETREYMRREQALEAVGMSEQDAHADSL